MSKLGASRWSDWLQESISSVTDSIYSKTDIAMVNIAGNILAYFWPEVVAGQEFNGLSSSRIIIGEQVVAACEDWEFEDGVVGNVE